MSRLSRRNAIKIGALGVAGLASAGLVHKNVAFASNAPYIANKKIAKKVIALGFDGMDPELLKRFIAEGIMPNFERLLKKGGHLGKLKTTMPPQSPVAWSSFITGTNPGGHGIYDFIHRDPSSFTPYLSTSQSTDATSKFKLGTWNIPLNSGKVELMRKGPAFYSVLEEHGVDSTLFQIPANFPVTSKDVKAVSGMGTPDILGDYGTLTYFTETHLEGSEHFNGARIVRVRPIDHVIKTTLVGPKNSLKEGSPATEIPLTINRDPWESSIRINIDDQNIVLKQGEWSEWIPLKYKLMPMFASVSGMVRFYVKEVHPYFKLYCSPINVDPMEPSMPICSPAGYSREISQAVGRFYTQGLPADTKALSLGVLNNDEYLSQAKIVLDENLRVFEHEFERFKEGFFFFYFSSVDQNCHMLWRCMDTKHPLYDDKNSAEVKGAVRYFYTKMDQALGLAMTKLDDQTVLMALSDHGFAPFHREFHLSTWLLEEGFTAVTQREGLDQSDFYKYVDWSKTKAYALGINGIYINLEGRENHGSVKPDEMQAIKSQIIAKLSKVKDHKTGINVVAQVFDADQIYSGPYRDMAPDLLVGYERGYRISDDSILGKFPNGTIADRTNAWSADHCMAPDRVPGILLINRPSEVKDPALWDMAPTILNALGLPVPSAMEGKNIL